MPARDAIYLYTPLNSASTPSACPRQCTALHNQTAAADTATAPYTFPSHTRQLAQPSFPSRPALAPYDRARSGKMVTRSITAAGQDPESSSREACPVCALTCSSKRGGVGPMSPLSRGPAQLLRSSIVSVVHEFAQLAELRSDIAYWIKSICAQS